MARHFRRENVMLVVSKNDTSTRLLFTVVRKALVSIIHKIVPLQYIGSHWMQYIGDFGPKEHWP